MKRVEIFKEDELKLSILVNEYDITIYTNSFEVTCKVDDIETSYSIPLNKGYKIVAEV